MVTVAAIALGRERANRHTAAALALASAGLLLVLAGAGAAALDPLGTLLGISAAVIYSTYVLTSAGVAERLGPLVLSALVCTGAATTLTLAGAAGGDLRPGNVSAAGFGWLAALAGRRDGRGRQPVLRRVCGASAPRPPRSSRRPSR